MKRIAFILTFILLLSGCNNSSSIGIIGGADGPTSIIVGETNKDIIESVKIINSDGVLYYDSGANPYFTPTCGTLDGNLKKTSDEYLIPQENDGANFDIDSDYFGYQSYTSIAKIVPINDEWRVFKKIDPDDKLYKYVYKVKGRHPNAVKDSEYIIMADSMDVQFNDVTQYFFSSQLKDHLVDFKVIHSEIYDEWGILMYAQDVTPKGVNIIIEQFGGEISGTLQTGAAYTLEVFENEEWVPVKTKNDEPLVWNSLAYMLSMDEINKYNINFEFGYDDLSKGRYRIGKEIMYFRDTYDYDTKMYYAEFEI